jgi:hypothetical protein
VRPFDSFLDFFRVDPVPGNMADVVQIPIEGCYAVQHSYSIYNYCIYEKAIKPIAIDEIRWDELCAVLTIAEEWDLLEWKKLPGLGRHRAR